LRTIPNLETPELRRRCRRPASADITPKSPGLRLAALTDEQLLEVIVQSPEAAALVKQGVQTKQELLLRMAKQSAPALPKPDPDDEELLR